VRGLTPTRRDGTLVDLHGYHHVSVILLVFVRVWGVFLLEPRGKGWCGLAVGGSVMSVGVRSGARWIWV
jgi:hypothetical protein